MKLSHLVGAAFLAASQPALVQAADCVSVALGAIPSCAQSCFLNGAPSIGCAGTDFACQCENEAKLYAAIEGCVSDGCPSASYQAVIDGASTVCNCATAALGGAVYTVSGSYPVSFPAATTGTIKARSSNTVIPGSSSPATTTPATTAPPTTSPTASPSSGAGKLGLSMAASSVVVALLASLSF